MPAEWQPHASTWLAWPHNVITWPGKRLAAVEDIYGVMIEALMTGEVVNLLVNDAQEEKKVRDILLKRKIGTEKLKIHYVPTVDSWIRDYGPTYVKNGRGEKAWCKWIFNAWGGKYEDLATDTRVFDDHQQLVPHQKFSLSMVLEGGSIEVNGSGVCLTTEQCLLNKNRNPHLSKIQIENNLREYLGVEQILWLEEGIEADDTDGHIDDITRFVSEDTILSAWDDETLNPNHEILEKNWRRLKTFRDLKDRKFNLIKFPMPGRVMDEGAPLPASYANFYIGNSVVLLPVYKHRNDKEAARILKELFPKKDIVSIPCTPLVYGLGSIHCVTQQEPA